MWESLKKLGQFNKEKGEFTKRTKSTTAPYPELNREALAYVYDKLSRSLNGNVADEPEKLQKLLLSGNFGKLYAHALLEATSTKEIIKTIEGSWKKYNQTNDPRTARRLSGSLQGYGTGWCTAGQETASKQLQGGDFYVYYTKDEEAKDTIPRVAIRMKNGEVAEVRGIRDAQELEPELYDIVDAKLKDLPGGAEYQTKVADMKRVTEIYNLVKKDSEVELSTDDLRFIYELDKSIKGFGYYTDPRIEEIITGRDVMQDYSQIYETSDRAELAKALIAEGRSYIVADNLDKFEPGSVDHAGLAKTLITEGKALVVASILDDFEPGSVDHAGLAKALIAGGYSLFVARNLDKFKLSEQQKKQLGLS